MKYLVLFAVTLCSISCIKERSEVRILTELQKQYISSLELRDKVYMEGCLKSSFISFNSCIEKLSNLGKLPPTKQLGVGDIAVGTAIGRALVK